MNTPSPEPPATDPQETTSLPSTPPPVASFRPSLFDLDQLVRQPFFVRIQVIKDSEPAVAEIECREMTPAEAERVAAIIRSVKPKVEMQVGTDGISRHHFRTDDPEYQARRAEATLNARAVALYIACPMIAEAFPNLKNPTEIRQAVESRLTDQILQTLWEQVVPAAPTVNEAFVNFS